MIIYGKNVRNSGSKVNTSYLNATQDVTGKFMVCTWLYKQPLIVQPI